MRVYINHLNLGIVPSTLNLLYLVIAVLSLASSRLAGELARSAGGLKACEIDLWLAAGLLQNEGPGSGVMFSWGVFTGSSYNIINLCWRSAMSGPSHTGLL